MADAYIYDAVRTPRGKGKKDGSLHEITALSLASQVLEALRPWLEDERAVKVGHHVKFDVHVFANHGVAVRGYRHDTQLQSYVLEAHRPHTLESLADRHLGRRGASYEEVCGKGVNQIPFAQVELTRAAAYSGTNTEMVLQVHQTLWPKLRAEPKLLDRSLFETAEVFFG